MTPFSSSLFANDAALLATAAMGMHSTAVGKHHHSMIPYFHTKCRLCGNVCNTVCLGIHRFEACWHFAAYTYHAHTQRARTCTHSVTYSTSYTRSHIRSSCRSMPKVNTHASLRHLFIQIHTLRSPSTCNVDPIGHRHCVQVLFKAQYTMDTRQSALTEAWNIVLSFCSTPY